MKRVAVFGLGRFGDSVARTLHDEGVEVLAVDRDRHLVDKLKDHVSVAVSFDATDRENLERFEIGHMDAVVVGIGDHFEASVMVTLLCKELGVPHIICKALTPDQAKALLKIGADQVVQPEHQMGRWLAENMLRDSVVNMVELPEGYSLARIRVRESWCGRTLAELRMLSDARLNLIQVHRRPQTTTGEPKRIPLPSGNFKLLEGDVLDVIGENGILSTYEFVNH
ncbi:TrkA family potassium uptake protein [bacterium]|nr:TrkA family potassium uptake protein [bacterium]MBU1073071.1 TrkA family potassium uptake protein [bacterium]MBU1674273.1 TrkA family potassium uptake protein [bacterium]